MGLAQPLGGLLLSLARGLLARRAHWVLQGLEGLELGGIWLKLGRIRRELGRIGLKLGQLGGAQLGLADLGEQLGVLEGALASPVAHDPVAVVGEAAGHVGVGEKGLRGSVDDLVEVLELAGVLARDGLVHEGAGQSELVEHGLVSARVRPVAPLLIDDY